MPVLLVENVSQDLFRQLQQLAAADHVPLEEEALRLLRQALELNKPLARANILPLLSEIRRRQITPAPGTPDSVELLREDRSR